MLSQFNRVTAINFNSKSAEPDRRALLSNFYGGVEFEYISQRYTGPILHFLDQMELTDFETFLTVLKQLQPKKKWNPAKEKYWTRNGEPVHGIIAKLVGNAVKDPKRLKMLQEMVTEVNIKEQVPDSQKLLQMAFCLLHKFVPNELYRNVLLSTGDAILHEKPLRGKGAGNNWTHKKDKNGVEYGHDWLGQMLMWIRADLRDNEPPLQDFIYELVEKKRHKLQQQLASNTDTKLIEHIKKELQLCV